MVFKIIIAIIAFYNQVDMFGGPQYMKHVIPKLVRTLFITPKEFSLDMKSLYQGPGCVLGSTWFKVESTIMIPLAMFKYNILQRCYLNREKWLIEQLKNIMVACGLKDFEIYVRVGKHKYHPLLFFLEK